MSYFSYLNLAFMLAYYRDSLFKNRRHTLGKCNATKETANLIPAIVFFLLVTSQGYRLNHTYRVEITSPVYVI